jgi:hypothetical protein
MEDEEKKAYEFSIAGFNLKLNNTMIAMAIPIITTIGGAMWGAFEFYKDYMDMKSKIQEYVAPDLSEFDKRLAVLEKNSQASLDYTSEIKNDLKSDIRRTEGVVESIERSVKQSQRDTDADVKLARSEVERVKRDTQDRIERFKDFFDKQIEKLKKETDDRIKKALDNPLSNKE